MSQIIKHQGNSGGAIPWEFYFKGKPPIQCIVTSPPYWGKRDYPIEPRWWGGDPGCVHEQGFEHQSLLPKKQSGATGRHIQGRRSGTDKAVWYAKPSYGCRCGAWLGQLGQEPTPHLYIEHLCNLLDSLPLADTGCMWVNIGDTYIAGKGRSGKVDPERTAARREAGLTLAKAHDQAAGGKGKLAAGDDVKTLAAAGLKPKDMALVPQRFAIAMQERGWWVRSEVIWFKKNGLPEAARDRPTRAHETIWFLTKNKRYDYHEANYMEPTAEASKMRQLRGRTPGHKYHADSPIAHRTADAGSKLNDSRPNIRHEPGAADNVQQMRPVRDVWHLATAQSRHAHIAPMPEDIAEICILLSTDYGQWVFDPFAGTGTTLRVAERLGRNAIGVDMDEKFGDFTADIGKLGATIFQEGKKC